jgi:hypothetical protein
VAGHQAKGDEQSSESSENKSFEASSGDGDKDSMPREKSKTAADDGLAALLREANLMRDTKEEMPRNLIEGEAREFALPGAHIRAAGAYAQRAHNDKRDEVLRPGAVFSAMF